MLILSITLHNIPEGLAVGVAFAAAFSFIAGGAELSIIPLIITQLVFSVIGIVNTKAKIR